VLALLLTTYALASALPIRGWALAILAAVQGITVVVTLAASGASRYPRRLAAVSAALAVAIAIGAALIGGRSGSASELISSLLLTASLIAIIRRLAGHQTVTTQTLLGAVSCYVLFGLIYTFVYRGSSESRKPVAL
jgi:hypothetical protein